MLKKPLTILLVEDSPEYATMVQRWLNTHESASECVLNWADTLEAGCQRLAQGGVDVVLLDLGLPDSDETTTFEAICRSQSGLPIIILSGADSEPLALQMIQHGAQDYLLKTTCTADQ